MIKKFFIVRAFNGNIISLTLSLSKISEQPPQGFDEEQEAEKHLSELFNKKEFQKENKFEQFIILPFYYGLSQKPISRSSG